MGVELADFFLALKPREQWKKARTQAELVEKMREAVRQDPRHDASPSASRSRCA